MWGGVICCVGGLLCFGNWGGIGLFRRAALRFSRRDGLHVRDQKGTEGERAGGSADCSDDVVHGVSCRDMCANCLVRKHGDGDGGGPWI